MPYADPQKKAEAMRNRVRDGLCASCSKKHEPGKTRCKTCAERRRKE